MIILLKPIEWIQEIREDYRMMWARCRPGPGCDVLLLNGEVTLRDYADVISISMSEGPLEAEQRQRSRLSEQALGGIFAGEVDTDNYLHGWFVLSENFSLIWDQVRDGNYSDCAIDLDVEPVEFDGKDKWIWKNNEKPLSIEHVYFRFTRKTHISEPTSQAPVWKGFSGYLFSSLEKRRKRKQELAKIDKVQRDFRASHYWHEDRQVWLPKSELSAKERERLILDKKYGSHRLPKV